MTLHYCGSEKSAVICGEIEEGVSDLLAGGSVCLWSLHILTFLSGSESILAAAGFMAGMVFINADTVNVRKHEAIADPKCLHFLSRSN